LGQNIQIIIPPLGDEEYVCSHNYTNERGIRPITEDRLTSTKGFYNMKATRNQRRNDDKTIEMDHLFMDHRVLVSAPANDDPSSGNYVNDPTQ
jgi:hypothetical protein